MSRCCLLSKNFTSTLRNEFQTQWQCREVRSVLMWYGHRGSDLRVCYSIDAYLTFDVISVRYEGKGTSLVTSQWRSQPPPAFVAAAMRPSNTVCIRWFKTDKRDSWDFKVVENFRILQRSVGQGINSLPLVCFRVYGDLSSLTITIPRLAFDRAWYCDAACG